MSVTLSTTHGNIKVELYCQKAPKTSKLSVLPDIILDVSFIESVVQLDDLYRNIKGFAVQTGDPTNLGKNGESIYGKYFEDEIHSDLKHDRRGIVSMAHKGQPNTNGSQFFITYSRQPHLNGSYTVFGKVIDGWETLDKIEKEPVGKKNRPLKPIIITDIHIHSNPIADQETD